MERKKGIIKKNNGITLIALVITIIILLILAGITISAISGENGLLAKTQSAKQAQIKSEMKEMLVLAIQELQIEKTGNATLDDITQEWIEKIEEYESTIQEDSSISGKKAIMKKDGVTGKFIIDENLNVIEIETTGNKVELTYETLSRNGDNVYVLITITDEENGIKQVECPNGNICYGNGKKTVAIDSYEMKLGEAYVFKITSENGQETEETIQINEYYHNITKNLGEGISIDNVAIKAEYNKPYEATITAEDGYIIDTLTVTMGGQAVTVDKDTGKIKIDNVDGDIEITATARKIEITTTTPIIGTSTTATSSVDDNSQTRGTTLYIIFDATLEGNACTIVNKDDNQSIPYAVTKNGTYTFIVTGTYNGKTMTKEIDVTVNKYEAATGLVQYDAGTWTQEEIDTLDNNKLYDLNESRTVNSTFKLNDDSGLNFTFGGFKAGDSRNNSISPQSGFGTPKYDGWQILESNEQDGKTYVTKLVHAGSPENFIYYYTKNADSYRAVYLLSSGQNLSSYNTLSGGTVINPRIWDMYKDKTLDEQGIIKDVHVMTETEADSASSSIRAIGSYYWLADDYNNTYMKNVIINGNVSLNRGYDPCWGVRPVVELNEGVYIASGTGTEADPYILGKD